MKSVVILSGGQDSTTCLGVALAASDVELAITFDYGQKHAVEVERAAEIAAQYMVPHKIIDLKPVLSNMTSSALINHGDTTQPHRYLTGLPASFVPARNALFLTIAYGLAMEHGCKIIYAGMCQTDYSGYPDCRDEFIEQLNIALNVGYETRIEIITPVMWIDKAATFKLAEDVGILQTVIDKTITCYDGITDIKHDWGSGCGTCPACTLRAKGWEEYLTRYKAA